jgi:alkanesulfonate monooxygenase SsuD/methylene tetrahydromethanopterin reductase-like flavin-dependent oxidoreductase (luciferase family)
MDELTAPRAMPKIPDGVMLGYFQPNTYAERFTTTAPGLTPCDYTTNRAVAILADEIGLSFALTIGRWKGIPGESVGYAMQGFDTYSLIAALLEATERITMISTTHTGLWNPVIAAKLGADMDQISGGRWGLNIVAGWNESEFRSMDAKLFDHEERYEQARHWLAAVRELWSTGESSYACPFFTLEGAECRPRPLQRGGPPIVNAGASPTGMQFAVDNADYLFGNWRVGDSFAEMRDTLETDVGYICERRIVLGRTDAEANDRADAILRGADLLALARGGARQTRPDGTPVPVEEVYARLRDEPEFRRRYVIADAFVGSPETVARDMATWLTSRPVEGVCMAMFDYERDLELFAQGAMEPLGNLLAAGGKQLVVTV